jgi:uncharacterized protein (TIGR02145 family)
MKRLTAMSIGLCVVFQAYAQEIKIGSQTCSIKNLTVTTYRNGDVIPQVTDSAEWVGLSTGAWCYYNNDPSNESKYGKLYNWFAVNDSRGLAPHGWHVPADKEWRNLSAELGGKGVEGKKMKSNNGWRCFNSDNNCNGSNESGFSALPGGLRQTKGQFNFISTLGNWWSITEFNEHFSRACQLADSDTLNITAMNKHMALSVRCVKD